MRQLVAWAILALTVGLALWRPRIRGFQTRPYMASLLGATLCGSLGLVSPEEVGTRLRFLVHPITTLVSLMAITVIAGEVGLFRWLAHRLATAARGDARRLYLYIFVAGTITGALFTNDAAVLIFTPMMIRLVDQISDESWSDDSRIAFYYSALYVANLVGLLVISNPINIVVADLFSISFAEYAGWMVLPALVSIAVTFIGLRLAFRRVLPTSYRIPSAPAMVAQKKSFRIASAAVLSLTLVGMFCEATIGLRSSYIAALGAMALALLFRGLHGGNLARVVRGIGWDVVAFVAGIFIVANGMRNAGATQWVGEVIQASAAASHSERVATMVTALVAGSSSAVMNNHPVAQIMALTIEDLPYAGHERTVKVLAALIGGDLGPKMLPIGSLAALLWFRILRDRGVKVTYRRYILIGVPVTLAALVLATLTLLLEQHVLAIVAG